jgi:ubiquinol-cytochrome c reductase iron-sulfur subunit
MTVTTLDSSRRHFLVTATTTLAVVGTALTAVPFLASWQPTSQTRMAGRPAEVDITKLEDGEGVKILWRGTPVWIVRRSAAVIAQLASLSDELKDPETFGSEQPAYVSNPTRSRRADIMVLTAVCTHLGCIPELRSADDAALGAGMLSGFVCPCHGSRFDAAGRVLKGSPASINLAIPPHYFMNDAVLVVGAEGPEQPA